MLRTEGVKITGSSSTGAMPVRESLSRPSKPDRVIGTVRRRPIAARTKG